MGTPHIIETESMPINESEPIVDKEIPKQPNSINGTIDNDILKAIERLGTNITNSNTQSVPAGNDSSGASKIAKDLAEFTEAAHTIKKMTSNPMQEAMENGMNTLFGTVIQNGFGLMNQQKQKEPSFFSTLATTVGQQIGAGLTNPDVVNSVLNKLTPSQVDNVISGAFAGNNSPTQHAGEYTAADLINADPENTNDVMIYADIKGFIDFEEAKQSMINEQIAIRTGQDNGEDINAAGSNYNEQSNIPKSSELDRIGQQLSSQTNAFKLVMEQMEEQNKINMELRNEIKSLRDENIHIDENIDIVDIIDEDSDTINEDIDIVNLIEENDDYDSNKKGAFEYDDMEDDDIENEFKEKYIDDTENNIKNNTIIMKKTIKRNINNIENNTVGSTGNNKIPRIKN